MDSPSHPLPPNRLSECEEQVDDDQVKDYGQLYKETADDECCNEPDTVKVYQTEGTPFISHASSATDLRDLGATGIDGTSSKSSINSKMSIGHNVTGNELSTKSTTNGNVKQLYTVHEHDIDYTPMIFSRNSSVSSLGSLDCPLDVNDADSVASEFSRRSESQAVSPSELPDSPGEPIQEKPSVSSQGNNNSSHNNSSSNNGNSNNVTNVNSNSNNGSKANASVLTGPNKSVPSAISSSNIVKAHPPPLPPKPLAFSKKCLPPARLPNYEDYNDERPKVFGVEGTPAAMSHATSISELSFISHDNHPVSASGSPSGSDDEAGTAMIQKCLNVGLKTSAAGQWNSNSCKGNTAATTATIATTVTTGSSNSVDNYPIASKFSGRTSSSKYSPVATVPRCSSSNELQSKHLTSTTANFTNSPPELPPRLKKRPVPPPRRSLIKPPQAHHQRSPASSTRSAPIFTRKEPKFILNYHEMPTNEITITLPPPADFADLSEVDTVQEFKTEDTPAQLSQATSISDLSFSMYSFNLSNDRQLCEIEQEQNDDHLQRQLTPPIIEQQQQQQQPPPPAPPTLMNDSPFKSVPMDKVPIINEQQQASSPSSPITLPMAQLHVSTLPGLATSTTTSTSVINADHESCNSIRSPPPQPPSTVPPNEDETLSESEYAMIQRCLDLGLKRVSESYGPLLASTQSKKPLPLLPDAENDDDECQDGNNGYDDDDDDHLPPRSINSKVSLIATGNTVYSDSTGPRDILANNNNREIPFNNVNNNIINSNNNHNNNQIENSNSNSAMTKANANLLTNFNATLSSIDSNDCLLIEHRAVSRNSDDNNNGSKGRLGTSSTYSTLTRRRKGYLETDIDSIANYEEYMKAQQVNKDTDSRITNYEEFLRNQQQSKDTFV